MTRPRNLFQAIEQEFAEMDKQFERVLKDLKSKDWSRVPADKIAFYGWSFDVGPDGIPHVHEFGNVKPGETLPSGTRQPLLSKTSDAARGEMHVTVELPGVEKSDVSVDATRDAIRVHAGTGDHTFDTNIQTGDAIDTTTVKATYRNGVLDVTAKHATSSGGQKRSVPIE